MRTRITATPTGLRKPLAAAVAALMLAQAPLTDAAIFRELSEEALAEMRGKFVVGQHIQYFGMSVTTTWARTDAVADAGRHTSTTTATSRPSRRDVGPMGPGGATEAAGSADTLPQMAAQTPSANTDGVHRVNMSLQVDNSGPATRVAYQVGGTLGEPLANTPAPAPNTPAPAPNGALAQIDGAVQAIQVSGSNNEVKNNVGYAVIPTDAAPVLADVQVTSPPVDQTFQNGDMVTQFTTTGGVGFTITSQGNQVTQRLGMNPVTNHSQLLQAVRLEGDGHNVVNDLMLQVAFENAQSQPDGLRFRADRVMNLL
ncbi:MAG: hypothetical protein AB7S51_06815 [Porticoccaceae bacterium]